MIQFMQLVIGVNDIVGYSGVFVMIVGVVFNYFVKGVVECDLVG